MQTYNFFCIRPCPETPFRYVPSQYAHTPARKNYKVRPRIFFKPPCFFKVGPCFSDRRSTGLSDRTNATMTRPEHTPSASPTRHNVSYGTLPSFLMISLRLTEKKGLPLQKRHAKSAYFSRSSRIIFVILRGIYTRYSLK